MKKILILTITISILMLSFIPASTFANSGVIDQSNGPGTNSFQIDYWEPCGQEFVPTLSTLIGVELYLYAWANAMGNSTITINIRPDSISEMPIATQSYVIPSDSPKPEAWIYFEFTTPVSVIPGNTYVLEVQSDTSYHMWYATGDTYSAGNMIKKGDILTSQDWSFRTYGASPTKAPYIDVDIDIKPGSEPNSINLRSKGIVPVAILTTDTYDATEIDPVTVELAGSLGSTSPIRWRMQDLPEVWNEGSQKYEGDGDQDLLFFFRTEELADSVLNPADTEATLTGETYSGTHIEGTDLVKIVPKGKQK